jgi:hypothetical protein
MTGISGKGNEVIPELENHKVERGKGFTKVGPIDGRNKWVTRPRNGTMIFLSRNTWGLTSD